ncbi:MAG: M20/M25/M40 family metallo-hydrolase [Acidimicrobiia bacterium]
MKRSTKLGLAVAGVTAAAAAIALKASASTNDVPSAFATKPEPATEPDVKGDAFLSHLGEAIRIDTTVHEDAALNSPDAILAFHAFLAETYPATHAACTVETVNDLSLLFTWDGADTTLAPMVLMAHMDVVPVEVGTEGDWTHPPFSGEVADGHLWGRGALDDKGPLIATIEAVEHLISSGFEPDRTVYLAFGHDEEIHGREGGRIIAETLRDRGVRPWLVIDEGGGVVDSLPGFTDSQVAMVKYAEKAYLDVMLTARAEGGHSSVPQGSTAVGQIAAAIQALEGKPVKARIEVLAPMFDALAPVVDRRIAAVFTNLQVTAPAVRKLMSATPDGDALMRTTTAVTMVSGGVKSNVLPQEAWAVVNFRIMPGDTIDSVLDHVRDTVGPDIEVVVHGGGANEPSEFSSIDSEGWEVVTTSIHETFPDATVAPWILTGATDSRYFMPFSEDVYGFAPFTVSASWSGIHGTDEAVRIVDAEGAVSFFCRLIRNANQG